MFGSTYNFEDTTFIVLAPNSNSYEEANNYSIVIKLMYKNTSYLFTGDAQKESEEEIISKYLDILKCDVLKVGHHGSSTSTSVKFLEACSPKYGVISVGKDNSYNHPHKSVLNRLKKYGVKIYRTDELGTITLTSDGENIVFDK